MKVLLVGPYETKGRYQGGIAYIVNEIINHSDICNNSQMNVVAFDVCTVNRSNSTQGKMSIGNIKNSLNLIRNLKKESKKTHPDVIYFNSSRGLALLKDLYALVIAKKKSSSKAILHIHFAEADKILPRNRILKGLILKLMRESVDKIVFLSKETQREFVKLGIERSKTCALYNFHSIDCDAELIKKKANDINTRSSRKMVFLGSIDERKGIFDLLSIFNDLDGEYELDICGNAPDNESKNKLNLLVQSAPSDKVHLRGYVSGDQKRMILQEADILVLPSYAEGFPIVLLEGLASGCAIITTRVGAIPEVFDDKNGALIEPGDKKALIQAISELSNSERLYKTIVFNYSEAKRYSINSFIKNMADICKETING